MGLVIVSLLLGWLAAGTGLILLAGFGLVLLLGLLYTVFGLSWLEIERVSQLYNLPVASLRWRERNAPGFSSYIRSVGRNLGNGRMWAAFGNFVLATLLGAGMLGALRWSISAAILAFAPMSNTSSVTLEGWELSSAQAPWLIPLALAGVGVVVALVFLHRAISTAIIGTIARETELAQKAQTSSVQREGAVRAAEVERTRIECDLHDGVQPRLVSVAMALGLAHQQIDTEPQQAKELIAEAHTSTKAAITELRQLTRGIYTSVLEDRGLDAALSAVAGRSHIPVQLDIQLPKRMEKNAEAAMYFAIAEALTNAAKHSRASWCRVTVRVREFEGHPWLWARIEDNGIGGAHIQPGGGLDGIHHRVLAAGGTLHLDSPQGGPTAVEVNVPCAS
ncbi:sensor histidine kinase [Glutamicibacter uratoxydans]|uniref:sensor histidine kinase n=1 Tax=Glutamicibacter uratoxydans TaxID=43667 RepID=UPI003D6EF5B7